jgi:NAD(P)-dependent dehydrogenase (short-subunit alcohol dehydrogenase family)
MQEQEKHSVAVVTGSSSGIGFETSLLLARAAFIRTPLCGGN